jgi:hypothetical protein
MNNWLMFSPSHWACKVLGAEADARSDQGDLSVPGLGGDLKDNPGTLVAVGSSVSFSNSVN